MSNQHDCKHNSTDSKKWEGYCMKNWMFYPNGNVKSGRFIKCQGLPCEDFEEKEVEE